MTDLIGNIYKTPCSPHFRGRYVQPLYNLHFIKDCLQPHANFLLEGVAHNSYAKPVQWRLRGQSPFKFLEPLRYDAVALMAGRAGATLLQRLLLGRLSSTDVGRCVEILSLVVLGSDS